MQLAQPAFGFSSFGAAPNIPKMRKQVAKLAAAARAEFATRECGTNNYAPIFAYSRALTTLNNAEAARRMPITPYDAEVRRAEDKCNAISEKLAAQGIMGSDFGFSIKKLAKKGLKVAVAPAYLTAKLSKAAFNLAVRPVRSRINAIVSGRARKLAMERRRSNEPNVAEKREARTWTKQRFRAKGPHGYMLATLAGGGDDLLGALGVVPAAVVAAVPALAALATVMAKDMMKSGAIALSKKAQAALTAKLQPEEKQAIEEVKQAAEQTEEQALEGVSMVKKPASNVGLGIGLGLGLVAAGFGVYAATR